MYILDGNVTTAIVDAIRSLMITFCSLIYRLIVFCFDVFEKIGAANDILSTDIIVNITNKISLILGLFMIFRLTFAFIQYLINPDTMTDKNKGAGNLVTKMIVMVVLLGSTPYMFKLAFSLQNAINEDKIIPRIIMGYSPDESNNATMGGMLAQSTFYTFFRINENVTCKDSDADLALVTTDAIEEDLKSADFSLLSTFVNQKCNLNDDSSKKDYIYELDAGGLGCLVIGVAVLYIVFIFTIQLAVRLFQLAYLQVIAPIPIMMYITPKGDEKLKKWGSQCLTTFLDYFLRTAIIYFVLYLIQEIISNFDSSSLSSIWQTGNNAAGKGYILGVLIIGLLAFAKKVPNLIKEIFPSLGGAAAFDYGLSFKKQVVEPLKWAYNTPLGWGLHAAKWTAQGIDRKAHGKNFFGPGRLRKKIDEILPEQAAARKEREEAVAARKLFEKQEKKGEELFNRRPDHKIDETFFKNQEFRKSWRTLKDAKDAEDLANEELKAENARYQAAFNSGDQREIAIAKSRVATAEKNLKVASGAVEKAQEFHDKNRAIYTKDREIEDRYTRYKKTHGTPEVYKTDAEILSEAGIGNITNTGTNTDTNTENGQNTNNRIIVEEHVSSQPRQETTSQETVQNEYSRLVNQYNNETDPSKKAAIRKQIDDFERRN